MSPVYTVESIGYLDPKISEHRHIFLDLFRQRKTALRTPYLGALSSVDRGSVFRLWTILFEYKHRFFKHVVTDTTNLKNILLSLVTRHQLMMA